MWSGMAPSCVADAGSPVRAAAPRRPRPSPRRRFGSASTNGELGAGPGAGGIRSIRPFADPVVVPMPQRSPSARAISTGSPSTGLIR